MRPFHFNRPELKYIIKHVQCSWPYRVPTTMVTTGSLKVTKQEKLITDQPVVQRQISGGGNRVTSIWRTGVQRQWHRD